MEQNIQRLSNQLQAMQQEVRELTQLAQKLSQQSMNQFQQWQGAGIGLPGQYQGNEGGTYHNLARNEQASLQLLHNLTEICQEMNQHLRNISQQMNQTGSAQKTMTFQPLSGASGTSNFGGANNMTGQNNTSGNKMRSGNTMSWQNQSQVPEGPVNQDTTHPAANPLSGKQQTDERLSSQMDTNSFQSTTSNTGLHAGTQFDANQTMSTNLAQQMTGQGTEGAPMQNQQQNSTLPNQGSSNQMLQVPTEAQLKNNLNENREEPQATQYPYNRYTT